MSWGLESLDSPNFLFSPLSISGRSLEHCIWKPLPTVNCLHFYRLWRARYGDNSLEEARLLANSRPAWANSETWLSTVWQDTCQAYRKLGFDPVCSTALLPASTHEDLKFQVILSYTQVWDQPELEGHVRENFVQHTFLPEEQARTLLWRRQLVLSQCSLLSEPGPG